MGQKKEERKKKKRKKEREKKKEKKTRKISSHENHGSKDKFSEGGRGGERERDI